MIYLPLWYATRHTTDRETFKAAKFVLSFNSSSRFFKNGGGGGILSTVKKYIFRTRKIRLNKNR
jgi:hypothetical protein